MNRNRVMRGLGLITLVMLAFGLAGCGSEPAPVARPPAPPPAPPPFQPQAVEVALGESGDTVTLMTAEGGGFTLNGEAFAGGEVTAENGNMYLLALADGTWTAAFQEPAGIEVMLGDHGGTVIITMTEDGKYFIGEMEITADTMVMGENGQYYTPALDEEGMWVAMHVMEAPVSVMLSDHGGTAMLQLAEDNTWWYDGMLFEDGGMVAGDNGQYYTLSMDEEGMWMAMHVMEAPVMVTLGDHGGSRMLQLAEDNTWWYDGMLFEDGDMLMGDNGQSYTLMMDEEGMWMSMHVMEAPVTVALGTSGSVDLQQAEDNSWWIGEMAFASGDTYTANGNEYMLTYDMATGMWASDFQPMSMEIMGTGLMAMSREADDMYDVGEDTLPASGMGDVTVDGAMYHVWMDEDGMLMGARFDAGINGDTDMTVGHLSALPTLSADDEDTDANEKATMLTVAGSAFPIEELLGSGTADAEGDNFVAKARADIEKIRDQAALLVNAFDFEGADSEDKDILERQLERKWTAAESALNKVFGAGAVSLRAETDADDVVDEFDELVDALSTLDAFEDAVDEDGSGVLKGVLEETGLTAAEVFDAVKSEARVMFGVTGDTRYGAVAKKDRALATSKLKHGLADDEKDIASVGAVGAFAYATIDDTVRTHHIQTSGSAFYEGGTVAASGDGTLYSGDIALEVRFRSEKVSGLVTNLESEEGEPWQYLVGDVHSIVLPEANLRSTASWTAKADRTDNNAGRANYTPRPGSPGAQMADATFAGHLLGTGEDAGSQAVGTWSFGEESNQAKKNYISGGFGAMRTEIAPGVDEPVTGDGTETETTVIVMSDTDASEEGRQGTMVLYNEKEVTRLLGAGLGDGKLTVHGRLYDGNTVEMADVDGDMLPILDTLEVSLATLFDKAGSSHTQAGSKQVDIARAVVQSLRDRLERVMVLDNEDASQSDRNTATDLRNDIWKTLNAVVTDRIFAASGVKRTVLSEDADAVDNRVMTVVDATGDAYQWSAAETVDTDTVTVDGNDYLYADKEDDGAAVTFEQRTNPETGSSTTKDVALPNVEVVEIARLETDPVGAKRLKAVEQTYSTTVNEATDTDDVTETVGIDGTDAVQYVLLKDGTLRNSENDSDVGTDVDLVPKVGNISPHQPLGAMFPERSNGSADYAEALNDIDDVIEALSSESSLEDALAKQGIFEYLNLKDLKGTPDNYDDDTAVGAGDIWGRNESRLVVQLGTTNYTRFGVWRKETNAAANLGYNGRNNGDIVADVNASDENGDDADGDGPGSFAYSALPATEYESSQDSTFPRGGSATYTGETVALQPGLANTATETLFTGVITVTASWLEAWEEDGDNQKIGSLTAVITGLETANGDPLEYKESERIGRAVDNPQTAVDESEILADNPDTDALEDGYIKVTGMEIREIIFTGVDILTPTSADKNELSFDTNFAPVATDGDDGPRARILTEIGDDPMTLVGGDTEADTATASLVGTFVGQDVDGPLGVLGTWTLMDADDVGEGLDGAAVGKTVTKGLRSGSTTRHVKTTSYILNDVNGNDADVARIGNGMRIYGAFGAEVNP